MSIKPKVSYFYSLLLIVTTFVFSILQLNEISTDKQGKDQDLDLLMLMLKEKNLITISEYTAGDRTETYFE